MKKSRKIARAQQLVLWKIGPVLFITLIFSFAVLYIITNGTRRWAEAPLGRTPLVERQFAEGEVPEIGISEDGVGHTIDMRRHGRNGEQPDDGVTETTANSEDSQRPYTESNNVMRGTLRSEKVDKATTICRGHFENSAACTTKLHEFNRRQNVSADANDASNYVASTPVTAADRLHTTLTSPDASDASYSISLQSSSSDASSPEDTNESDEVAADSQVHSDESAPDASNLPEVPTVAGVAKSTESSTETSQSPQFPLAFDPDEVAGVVPDEIDADASEEATSPPLNDATAENDTRGGGLVEQRELVDVSSVSADDFNGNNTDLSSTEVDLSTSPSVQSDTTDYGNASDSSESTSGASDEPFSSTLTLTDSETMSLTEHTFTDDLFNATLREIGSETISLTERIASDESLNATLAVTVSDTISLDELIVSDEPSDATLIVTESSSMLFLEEITEVPANSSETDGNSTDGFEPTTISLTTDSDDHSEWQTEVNLTNISSEVMTAEIATGMTPDMTTDMTTTTLRTRKTRKSRKPITDKTRKPLPYSRHKVPDEKSLVCAITEDFSSYWLSFGFPFRYADVYPDHLCTHYIFSPLVFNELNDTDFSLYPHNFYRLEKFVRMRKQSNVSFIVSFDGDELLGRLLSQRSSENMQLFASNVHVFLRFYDFDGFDIYKIRFTVENMDIWTELLKVLNKELVSGSEYLLSVGFTYEDDLQAESLAETLKYVSFSNLITHVAPIDIWNSTVAEPPNHFSKVKREVDRVQAVRKLQSDNVMCYTLTLCIAHYVVLEGTPFDPARGEFFNFHEMSCDRISEMDTEPSKADGMSIVSADGSIYYAYDTSATLLDKIRQLDPHDMCVALFDVQCDDTDDCEDGRYSRVDAVKKEVVALETQRELMLQLRLRHGYL